MNNEQTAHGVVAIGRAMDPPVSPQRASQLLRVGRVKRARKSWCYDHGRDEWEVILPIEVLPATRQERRTHRHQVKPNG